MIWSVIISLVFNISLYIILTRFLINIPLLAVLGVFYLLPIVVNGILIVPTFLKKSKTSTLFAYVFPLISTITYWLIGDKLTRTHVWHDYAMKYTYHSSDMFLKTSNNLIDISQMIFIILLYFCVQFLILSIVKKRRRKKYNENN